MALRVVVKQVGRYNVGHFVSGGFYSSLRLGVADGIRTDCNQDGSPSGVVL
jgi:hypothetical protein